MVGCMQKLGVVVPLERCMVDIILKYDKTEGKYIFPILKSVDGIDVFRKYNELLRRYNSELKRLAKKADVNCNLTSYCVRHTWASVAYQQNVDLPVISKALGHTDTKTTMIYIRELNDNRLAEANDKILHSLGVK